MDRISEWKRRDEERRRELEARRRREQEEELRRLREQEREEKERRKERAERGGSSGEELEDEEPVRKRSRKARGRGASSSDSEPEGEQGREVCAAPTRGPETDPGPSAEHGGLGLIPGVGDNDRTLGLESRDSQLRALPEDRACLSRGDLPFTLPKGQESHCPNMLDGGGRAHSSVE